MKYLESKNASYTAAEIMVMDKTLFKNLSRICESGKIKKLGRGLYLKESVDAYIQDIKERKEIRNGNNTSR